MREREPDPSDDKWFTEVEPSGADLRGREASRRSARAMYDAILAPHRKRQMTAHYTLGDTTLATPCPWLTPDVSAIAQLIARNAHAHIGVCEEPPGSNRGPEIDEWNRRARVAVGSYWCASFAGAMWWDAGLTPPPGYASCDKLMQWGKATGRWSEHVVGIGSMVLYGKPGDANHVGIVIRAEPIVITVEGNTTFDTGFSRNGIGVAQKQVTDGDPVLGYIAPLLTPTPKVA